MTPSLLLLVVSVTGVCPPTAIIDADLSVEPSIRAALESSGVDVLRAGVATECEAIRAVVRERDGRLSVVIQDSAGRMSDRWVGSPELAAVLVESWLMPPDEALFPVPRPIAAPIARAMEGPAPPVTTSGRAVGTVLVGSASPSRLRLAALAEIAAGEDRSIAFGPSMSACVRFGWLCLDTIARFAYGLGETDASIDTELATGVSFHLDLGAVELAPGLSTGISWIHARARGFDAIDCPPEAPCVIGERPAAPADTDQFRPKAHLSLAGLITIADATNLKVQAGLTWSPLAETETLLREARWSFRLGVGLELGLL